MSDPLIKIKQNLAKAQECLNYPSEITAWEIGFLNNIITRLKNNYQLSERQQDTLDDLEKKLIERMD